MSVSTEQHRREAPDQVCCGVVTVSDTRTLDNDRGGQLIVDLLTAAGTRAGLARVFLRHIGPQATMGTNKRDRHGSGRAPYK